MKKLFFFGLVLLFLFATVGYAAETLVVPESYHGKITFTTKGLNHYTTPYIGAGSGRDNDYRYTLTETGQLEMDLKCMMYYWQNIEKTVAGTASLEEKYFYNEKLESAKICPFQTLDPNINANVLGSTLLVIDYEKKLYGFMTRIILTGDKLMYNTNTGQQTNRQSGGRYEIKFMVKNQKLPSSSKSLKGKTTLILAYDGKENKSPASQNSSFTNKNITTRTIVADKREIAITWDFASSATTTETMIMPGMDVNSFLKQE
jgi:hypothetical protein